MVQAEAIQSEVTKAAIQGDAGAISGANTVNPREVHRQRHGGPAVKQLSFNLNAPGKYVELVNFEVEVTNILQTKMYRLTKRKSP